MNEKIEYVKVEISQKEIKLKEEFVRDIIIEDLKKYDIDINAIPITINAYDKFSNDKQRGVTKTIVEDLRDPDTHKIFKREFKSFEVNFISYPPPECTAITAHHEAAHIIKQIKHRFSFNYEDDHGDIFQDILKTLNKNFDKNICKTCQYANKKIYVERI